MTLFVYLFCLVVFFAAALVGTYYANQKETIKTVKYFNWSITIAMWAAVGQVLAVAYFIFIQLPIYILDLLF